MYAMRTIFLKATEYAAWVAIAFAVSSVLWVLSFGQALAGFCPAASCSVALMNGNSLGTGAFDNMNFAVSVNVATFDLNLSNGNRVGKVDFPSAPGLADNLGGKLTMANLKSLIYRNSPLRSATGRRLPTSVSCYSNSPPEGRRDLLTRSPLPGSPNPPLSRFLPRAFFSHWDCCAGNG